MKRLALTIAITLTSAACLPAAAQAAFGINHFDVTFTGPDGSPIAQAGSHPFAMTTSFAANLDGDGVPEGSLRDIVLGQIPGLLGDTTAYPRCTTADFLDVDEGISACSAGTAVGITGVSADEPGSWHTSPVFNLIPSPGELLRLGFVVFDENVVIDVGLEPFPPYNAIAALRDIPQTVEVLAAKTQLWGDPADPAHDGMRGECGVEEVTLLPGEEFEFEGNGAPCPVALPLKSLLTLPTSCAGPQESAYEARSWEGAIVSGSAFTHDGAGDPLGFTGCGKLAFDPSVVAKPTTNAAQSPTGLDFSIDVNDEGLVNPAGISQSGIRDAVVTLPEGLTLNPAAVKAFEVCSDADLAEESLQAVSGEGCPDASRVGTVEVESPLVEEPLEGSVFIAEHSTLCIVVKDPELGIIVKQLVEIETDPETGQLIAIADDIPKTAALSHFELHLGAGNGGPLVSPPMCGTYESTAEMTPWSAPNALLVASTFQIVTGPDEGPCPQDLPSLEPDPEPSSTNDAAGAAGSPPIGAGVGPGPSNVSPQRPHCPKGKRRVRRNGKAHCVKKHRAKKTGATVGRDQGK